VDNKSNYSLLCLPTPQHYLRGKRQTILTRYKKVSKKVDDLRYKLYAMKGLADDLKLSYEKIDYQLAEIDGRLKRKTKHELENSDKKVNDKVTSIGFSMEQIAKIANALNISLEVDDE